MGLDALRQQKTTVALVAGPDESVSCLANSPDNYRSPSLIRCPAAMESCFSTVINPSVHIFILLNFFFFFFRRWFVCGHVQFGLDCTGIWSAIILHHVCHHVASGLPDVCRCLNDMVCSRVTPSIMGLRDFCAIIGLGGTAMKEGVHLSNPIYTEL